MDEDEDEDEDAARCMQSTDPLSQSGASLRLPLLLNWLRVAARASDPRVVLDFINHTASAGEADGEERLSQRGC